MRQWGGPRGSSGYRRIARNMIRRYVSRARRFFFQLLGLDVRHVDDDAIEERACREGRLTPRDLWEEALPFRRRCRAGDCAARRDERRSPSKRVTIAYSPPHSRLAASDDRDRKIAGRPSASGNHAEGSRPSRFCCSSDSVRSVLRASSSLNNRTSPRRMTAWSAKGLQQLDLLVREWPDLEASDEEGARATPSRNSGTAKLVRCPNPRATSERWETRWSRPCRSATCTGIRSTAARPATVARSSLAPVRSAHRSLHDAP